MGAPVQLGLSKSVKVTVPVGAGPVGAPATVAVAVMGWPRGGGAGRRPGGGAGGGRAGGAVQVGLLGPNTAKATVPVGVGPPPTPVTVAVSVMGWPRGALGVAEVTMAGIAGLTTEDSLASLQ